MEEKKALQNKTGAYIYTGEGEEMEKAQIILDTEKYETYINEIEEALKEYKECVKELKATGFIQERRKDESSINNRG